MNAFQAYYPTSLRCTGIGWSVGVGRVGSVIGPVLGGYLMRLQWSQSQLFIATAVPAVVSLYGIVGIRFSADSSVHMQGAAKAEPIHWRQFSERSAGGHELSLPCLRLALVGYVPA